MNKMREHHVSLGREESICHSRKSCGHPHTTLPSSILRTQKSAFFLLVEALEEKMTIFL